MVRERDTIKQSVRTLIKRLAISRIQRLKSILRAGGIIRRHK